METFSINPIFTGKLQIYYFFKAKLPSIELCLNSSKAKANPVMATLLLGLFFLWRRISFGLHPGLRNLNLCYK